MSNLKLNIVAAIVQQYIETHLDQRITIRRLALVAGLSTYYFIRSFRATVGVTPVRYLWSRRVEAAKRMLVGSATALCMVSLDCGFQSQSHFTTMFKEVTGETPGAYRRAHT